MVERDVVYAGPAIAKTEDQVPDKIIIEIIDELGEAANIKAIIRAYIDRSRGDPELADINAKSTALYAWNRVMQRSTRGRSGRGSHSEAAARTVATTASKMVEAIKAVCVMDLILPTGKRLRDSTFAECKAAGGLFTRLASKGKPNQIVGKVLSDQQAQDLWK